MIYDNVLEDLKLMNLLRDIGKQIEGLDYTLKTAEQFSGASDFNNVVKFREMQLKKMICDLNDLMHLKY